DCGRYAVKREVGDVLTVSADVFKEGHDAIAAAVRFRAEDETEGRESRMHFVENDRWEGSIALERNCRYFYTVIAWTDWFGSWRAELKKKFDAGQDVSSELLEGAEIIQRSVDRAEGEDRRRLEQLHSAIATGESQIERVAIALSEELLALVEAYPDRSDLTVFDRELPLQVDRVAARFASWYELFPRSMSDDPN